MFNFKKLMAFIVILSFVACPLGSSALAGEAAATKDVDPAVMVADFFAARPLGIGATVLGAATFLVSLPFSALGDNVDSAYQQLIVLPAKYSFKRPLGAFY